MSDHFNDSVDLDEVMIDVYSYAGDTTAQMAVGDSADVTLTAAQMRKLARILLQAAENLDGE